MTIFLVLITLFFMILSLAPVFAESADRDGLAIYKEKTAVLFLKELGARKSAKKTTDSRQE